LIYIHFENVNLWLVYIRLFEQLCRTIWPIVLLWYHVSASDLCAQSDIRGKYDHADVI